MLVGTDVASRGLHVEGVDCVVHFDPPEDEDTYVHRSGRTGRAGSTGRVVSLVTPDQETRTKQLQRRLGIASPLCRVTGDGGPSRARPHTEPRERRARRPASRPLLQSGAAAI